MTSGQVIYASSDRSHGAIPAKVTQCEKEHNKGEGGKEDATLRSVDGLGLPTNSGPKNSFSLKESAILNHSNGWSISVNRPDFVSCHRGKHFNPKHIQDSELRKRFDKNKTLKQNMEATNLKEMYKERTSEGQFHSPAKIQTMNK